VSVSRDGVWKYIISNFQGYILIQKGVLNFSFSYFPSVFDYCFMNYFQCTGMVGLENLGATCYLNALLQVWLRVQLAILRTLYYAIHVDIIRCYITLMNFGERYILFLMRMKSSNLRLHWLCRACSITFRFNSFSSVKRIFCLLIVSLFLGGNSAVMLKWPRKI